MDDYSVIKRNELLSHTTDESQNNYMESKKKPDIKEYILNDSIFMKFKNGQNSSMITEVRTEIPSEGSKGNFLVLDIFYI